MINSHVFVSHSSSDDEIVRKLREGLPDIKSWVDSREMSAGDDLDPEIRAAIDSAAHLIVIQSLAALESDWVTKELDYAREVRARRDGFKIIPVLVDPLTPRMAKRIFGQDLLAIPLAPEVPGAFDRLAANLADALGLELPADAGVVEVAESLPLADLVLELSDPGILVLKDEGKRRATARARLVYCPADRAVRDVTGSWFDFTSPLGPIETDDLKWYLERYSAWPSPAFQTRAKGVEGKLSEWGRLLYDGLAPDQGGDALAEWKRAEGSRRFSVLVEVDDRAEAEAKEAANLLLSLPWELVHDDRGYLFQGARGVRVRRQLPNRIVLPPLVAEPPIRVLLVSPRPEDDRTEYIDHRVSARPLVAALEPLGEMVDLHILQPPTFKALSAELGAARQAGRAYDVVHFDGHGVYDKLHGLGALCFEDPGDAAKLTERRTDPVQADQLAGIMRDHRVPLVFLEACQTAMADLDPTASVAGRLLDQGVASVVAMSHAVLVETARRFVEKFYGSLMRGERVGEAMLAGQRELADDTARGTSFIGELHLQDWFVPVLYQEKLDPPLITELHPDSVQVSIAKRRKKSLGKLPDEPGHHFVGRSRELLALERLLARERYAVVLGEGGEGKTTLAAEAARWLVTTRRFARAAFVSLEDALDVRSLLFALGDQLVAGFTADAAREPEKAVPLVERALREQRTIVVLDNLETVLEPPQGAPGAEAFEPEVLAAILGLCEKLRDAGETRLVFTSREPLPAPFDRHVVRIGRLDKADAIELVGNVLGEDAARPQSGDAGDSEDEIERLVEVVNRHARSLVLVAREVAASGVRGATERLEELMVAMAERYGDDRERSLYASVELSLRRLPEATRRKLGRLGVFQGGGHLFVIGQVLELGADPQAAVELGAQLAGVGLGELLPYGHLRLHPALCPLLRRELDEAELDAARRVWLEAMRGLAGYLYQQRSQDVQIAATLTVLELPNLLAALELMRTSFGAEEVVGFATRLESLLEFLGRPRAMARAVSVREAAVKDLGDWSHAKFLAADSAVDRLLEAGRFPEALEAARSNLQRASAAGEGAYQGAAYDLALAHWKLGRVLRMGGAAEAALDPLAEAQRCFQELADGGGRNAAEMARKCLTETGDCLLGLGRFDNAAAAYEVSIQLAEELKDNRGKAVVKGQLGTVRMLQQRYEDALEAHMEARKTFEQLGEPGTVAIAWHQIGRVYEEARQCDAAEHAYQQSLRIKVQRGDRQGESSTLDQLGLLYFQMDRPEDAVRFHRQAAEIRTALGDLIKEGRSRSNSAIALIQLRRYDEARQELLRAIECKKPYGHAAQPWKTFGLLHDLERAAGNASAAEDAHAQAVDAFLGYRRAGGENHLPGGQLAAVVAQGISTGETAAVASQLADLGGRPDLPGYLEALVPVLQQIVQGSRDPSLASTPGLLPMDTVEVQLLLERLG